MMGSIRRYFDGIESIGMGEHRPFSIRPDEKDINYPGECPGGKEKMLGGI